MHRPTRRPPFRVTCRRWVCRSCDPPSRQFRLGASATPRCAPRHAKCWDPEIQDPFFYPRPHTHTKHGSQRNPNILHVCLRHVHASQRPLPVTPWVLFTLWSPVQDPRVPDIVHHYQQPTCTSAPRGSLLYIYVRVGGLCSVPSLHLSPGASSGLSTSSRFPLLLFGGLGLLQLPGLRHVQASPWTLPATPLLMFTLLSPVKGPRVPDIVHHDLPRVVHLFRVSGI